MLGVLGVLGVATWCGSLGAQQSLAGCGEGDASCGECASGGVLGAAGVIAPGGRACKTGVHGEGGQDTCVVVKAGCGEASQVGGRSRPGGGEAAPKGWLAQKLTNASMSCVLGIEAKGVSGDIWRLRSGDGGGEAGGVMGEVGLGRECSCVLPRVNGAAGLPGKVEEDVYLLIRVRCQRSSGKMLCPRMAVDTIEASSCCMADIGGKIHPDLVQA